MPWQLEMANARLRMTERAKAQEAQALNSAIDRMKRMQEAALGIAGEKQPEPDSPGGRLSGGGGGGATSPPRAGSPTHTPGRGGVNVPPEKKRMRGMLYWEIMKERGLVDRRDT